MKFLLILFIISFGLMPNLYAIDTDGDGIEDKVDLDSDNDCIPDRMEGFATVISAHPTSTYTHTSTTIHANGPNISNPSTGYVVTDTSTPGVFSFTAASPAENGTGSGTGTVSNILIKVDFASSENISDVKVTLHEGAFDDGLFLSINNIIIVKFDNSDYNNSTFNHKYNTTNSAEWTPWTNEGNPSLEIDLINRTVALMVDTAAGGRENALLDIPNSNPNDIPVVDFEAGVKIGTAYQNYDGPGSISAQVLKFYAKVKTHVDTDGDGIFDYLDADSDNDGINDVLEANCLDPDNDGKVGVGSITDGNRDGYEDSLGSITLIDTDNDGKNDNQDADSDNDGICDGLNASDGSTTCTLARDNCRRTSNFLQLDTDTDGLGDECDDDKDNDNVLNINDSDSLDNTKCSDIDNDTCDDCTNGNYDLANDGDDRDNDGICNDGDNESPSFTSTPITVIDEDSNYSYTIIASDLDGARDTLTYSAIVVLPSWLTFDINTQVLSGTPGNNEVGIYNITIRVNDGHVDIDQIFTITVNNTNDAPVFVSSPHIKTQEDLLYTYNIVVHDIDLPKNTLTITATTKPSWLTSFIDNGDGTATISGTPDNSNVGAGIANQVSLNVNDGTTNVTQVFIIEVVNVNDAPIINSQKVSPIVFNEDTSREYLLEDLDITDRDSNPANFSLTVLDGLHYSHLGNVITPDKDYNGNLSVMVKVNDGNGLDSHNFSILTKISSVNDNPIFTSTSSSLINEKDFYTYLLTATDIDKDSLTYSVLTSLPSGLSFNTNTHVISGTPDNNAVGSHDITVRVNDGTIDIDQSFTLNIANINDAPIIAGEVNSPIIFDEDTNREILFSDLSVLDVDNTYPNDFTLTVLAPSQNSHYTVLNNIIIPELNYNGALSVKVKVNDGALDSNVFDLAVIVTAIDDELTWDIPTPNENLLITVYEGTPLILKVKAKDVDNNLPVIYSLSPSVNGLTINSVTGEFSWFASWEQGGRNFDMIFTASDGNTQITRTIKFNVIYLDNDNDGLADMWEATNCLSSITNDTDGDGYSDYMEVGADINNPINTDNTDEIDACDTDSDNDGSLDGLNGVIIDSDRFNPNICSDTDSDTCEDCVNGSYNPNNDGLDTDNDGLCDLSDTDKDNDHIINILDNCEIVFNPKQIDSDMDYKGDLCDNDNDNDGIANNSDNCPFIKNGVNEDNQADSNGDLIGDACDIENGVTDTDGDGILNTVDNCPNLPNFNQLDIDTDQIGDVCDADSDNDGVCDASLDVDDGLTICDAGPDNCIYSVNGINEDNQADDDNDGLGNACDPDSGNNDIDDDGILNIADNCPLTPNSNQLDNDSDDLGDLCDPDDDDDGIKDGLDNCIFIKNTNQLDTDSDGIGDVCDLDSDNDGICDSNTDIDDGITTCTAGPDNCKLTINTDQADIDNNNIGDLCDDSDNDGLFDNKDNCNNDFNPSQSDVDLDGIGDACDPDSDNDGICDFNTDIDDGITTCTAGPDNCEYTPNPNQRDIDNNGIGDYCDNIKDTDDDGINNKNHDGSDLDNCINIPNFDQLDTDNDGLGDLCDDDIDNDGIKNDIDNCIYTLNPMQEDMNHNNIGDICETIDGVDRDGDTIVDNIDNCPLIPNLNQIDSDSDGLGDKCDDDDDDDTIKDGHDNCPMVKNVNQSDFDNDGIGDECDDDKDGDTILDTIDNCIDIPNTDQLDNDNDQMGDVCDDDDDNDNILDIVDNCPFDANNDQADIDENGIGDACDSNSCSVNNKIGNCKIDDTCVEGECKNACSITYINGYCIDDMTCVEGACTNNCSNEHLSGYCSDEMTCNEGACINICSVKNENGYCETGNCVDGECSDACSDVNPHGYCEEGKCFEGDCITEKEYKEYSGSSLVCSYTSSNNGKETIFILLFMFSLLIFIRRKFIKEQ